MTTHTPEKLRYQFELLGQYFPRHGCICKIKGPYRYLWWAKFRAWSYSFVPDLHGWVSGSIKAVGDKP